MVFSTNLYSNFFTRIRHMERRSDCTEVVKNVLFTAGIKKLTLSLLESSECDHWISLFSQSLEHGVKRGNSGDKEKS